MENKRLLHDSVLVEVAKDEVTASGLKILKETDPSDVTAGKIIKVGEKNTLDLTVGSTVLYQYGTKITVDGVQYKIVKTDDVLFVM